MKLRYEHIINQLVLDGKIDHMEACYMFAAMTEFKWNDEMAKHYGSITEQGMYSMHGECMTD